MLTTRSLAAATEKMEVETLTIEGCTTCPESPRAVEEFRPFLLEAGLAFPPTSNPIPANHLSEVLQTLLPLNVAQLRSIPGLATLLAEEEMCANLKRKPEQPVANPSKRRKKESNSPVTSPPLPPPESTVPTCPADAQLQTDNSTAKKAAKQGKNNGQSAMQQLIEAKKLQQREESRQKEAERLAKKGTKGKDDGKRSCAEELYTSLGLIRRQ